MAKVTLQDIVSGYKAKETLNENNAAVEAAIENTLSRDGTGPNEMEANLDMNSYRIINLPNAVQNQEPITLAQAGEIAGVTNPLTQEIIGSYLYPRTAAETAAVVTPVNYQYPELVVNRYATNTTPGTTDMTAAVVAARNVASQKAYGGNVMFLPEDYAVTDIELATGVYLVGTIQGEGLATQDGGGARLIALATGEMISCPASSTIYNTGVIGLGFVGLGSGTALIGVHFDNVYWGTVRHCSFREFADNAIKLDSDTIACTIQQNHAVNCLIDRTRAAKEGVLDVDGTDHRILEGEYTSSVSALTDANARCGAVVLRGAEHFIQNVVGEISDFGIATIGVTGQIRMFNVRADLNYGNGYEIGSSTSLTQCIALRNGRETTNTYDGFSVTGSDVSMSNCKAVSLSADSWKHRYGFKDTQASDSSKNYYDALCRSLEHATAAWNLATFAGAAHQTMVGSPKTFGAADATPSVADYGTFRTGGGTTITDLDDGFPGQRVEIYIEDTMTFDCTGTDLTGNGGADISCIAGDMVFGWTDDGISWRLLKVDCTA